MSWVWEIKKMKSTNSTSHTSKVALYLLQMKPRNLLLIPLLAIILAGCNYRELPENVIPIEIMGRLMLDPNTPAADTEMEFFQTFKNGDRNYERRSHGSTTTNSVGGFVFEYQRNNGTGGGKKCGFGCGGACRGLEVEVNGQVVAKCFKVNRSVNIDLFLHNTMMLQFSYDTAIAAGDTIFVNLVPVDTLHPNYYVRTHRGIRSEALALPGPVPEAGIDLIFRSRMSEPQYHGLNEQLRGPSLVFWSNDLNQYQTLFTEAAASATEGAIEDVRFRGEPFTDTVRLPN